MKDGQLTVDLVKRLLDVEISIDDAIILEHCMCDYLKPNWRQEFPEKPGKYWFYGNPDHGQMGCDYRADHPPIKPRLHIIDVHPNVATVDGSRFMSNREFDGTRPVWRGYFMFNSKFPFPPQDVMGLFRPGPDWKEKS